MLREIMELMELLDTHKADGSVVAEWLAGVGLEEVEVTRVEGKDGATDFIKAEIRGLDPSGPTLGIIGQLGGVGAFPRKLGLVSDADGAIVALASAAKLAKMRKQGDLLKGHVIVTTHICTCSPIIPHKPTPFMGSPVDMHTMNRYEVDQRMEAILSVDTTKGNRIVNHPGFAITPTVKEGYILRVSNDLLDIMEAVTNEMPVVVPISQQDITPYGNGLYHLNSILQPSTATAAPVVGVAITASIPVPGCATGANQPFWLERAARFCVEAAKAFTLRQCRFYDPDEYQRLVELYGPMKHFQTLGKKEM